MSTGSTRPVIVVDTETNGLNPRVHQVVEVAWWNLATDEHGTFIPKHNPRDVLADGDIAALRINRYIDRLASADQDVSYTGLWRLADQLNGATLAGSNPAFDAAMLRGLFDRLEDQCPPPEWHHRLWDLSAYAAGVLGLEELPGLARVCELLGLAAGPTHAAADDVYATVQCFKTLRGIARQQSTRSAIESGPWTKVEP